MNRKTLAGILAAIAAVIGVLIPILDPAANQPAASVTVTLAGPGHETVTVPAAPEKIVPRVDATIPDQNQRDNTDTSLAIAERNLPAIKKQTTGNDIVLPVQTLADFTQAGCATRPVRNFSSRYGNRPGLIVLHYTVSPNRPGSGDVASIVVYFDDPRAQASSNYVIDNEGNCAYIVSELNKAWTQGNMNFASACSFEVINTGHEPTYIGPPDGPGLAKLARVVHDCAHRWGIPIRAGATSGCTVLRTGIVDHNELACNNFHTDITPYSTAPVIAAAAALDVPACDTRCRRVAALRGKHQRTHARFRKNQCGRPGPDGQPRRGYCDTLRHRNAAVHIAAKREHVSLKGTYK